MSIALIAARIIPSYGERDQMDILRFVIPVASSTNFMAPIDRQRRRRRFIDVTEAERNDIVFRLLRVGIHGVLLRKETMRLRLPLRLSLRFHRNRLLRLRLESLMDCRVRSILINGRRILFSVCLRYQEFFFFILVGKSISFVSILCLYSM
jgi:hypothetical protein